MLMYFDQSIVSFPVQKDNGLQPTSLSNQELFSSLRVVALGRDWLGNGQLLVRFLRAAKG